MKVAKKLFFDIPGIGRVNAKPGSTFDPGGEERSTEKADTGIVGFSEETMEPKLSFVVPNTANVSIDQLRNLTDVDVTVFDDNGKGWVVAGCWTVKPTPLTNGEISVEMAGLRADPIN